MNYFSFYLSRTLAFVVIGVLMMGIQSGGAYLQQRRQIGAYERLGGAVCDGGNFQIDWWLWPPQARLSGRSG